MTLEKIIGKGALGQVAKGKAVDLRGRPGKTLVAIKKLRGVKCFKNSGKTVPNMLSYSNGPFLAWSLGRL